MNTFFPKLRFAMEAVLLTLALVPWLALAFIVILAMAVGNLVDSMFTRWFGCARVCLLVMLLVCGCTQNSVVPTTGSGLHDLIYPCRMGTNYETAWLNTSQGTNIFRPRFFDSNEKDPLYAKNP